MNPIEMAESRKSYFARIVDQDALAAYLEDELGAVDTYNVHHHQEEGVIEVFPHYGRTPDYYSKLFF